MVNTCIIIKCTNLLRETYSRSIVLCSWESQQRLYICHIRDSEFGKCVFKTHNFIRIHVVYIQVTSQSGTHRDNDFVPLLGGNFVLKISIGSSLNCLCQRLPLLGGAALGGLPVLYSRLFFG